MQLRERGDDARLADAGLARDQDEAAAARGRIGEEVRQVQQAQQLQLRSGR